MKPAEAMASAYTTEAPPPATKVQMRPVALRTVNLREAPVFASRDAMYASSGLNSRPKGAGNSIGGPASMLTCASLASPAESDIVGTNLVADSTGETQSLGAASNGPLGSTLKLGSLIELRGQIKEVNLSGGLVLVGNDNEGVDLEVGELAVDVNTVEAGNEVDKDIVDTLGNVLQESSSDLLIGREPEGQSVWCLKSCKLLHLLSEVDGDQETLSLSVNITDINTTLMGKENPVTL